MLSEQVSITKLTRHKINSTTFPQPNRICQYCYFKGNSLEQAAPRMKL